MGRPTKTGLDYFPLDTSWDIKMKLLKAKFHLLGVGCMTELFKAIYQEGYALKWDEDTKLLFADENSIDIKTLDEIIDFAFTKKIFSHLIFKNTGYLTSHGIQARWKKACVDSRRNNSEIDPDLDLLTFTPEEKPSKRDETAFPPEETELTQEETEKTPGESTQSKVNKSKVKESSGSSDEFPPEETTTTDSIKTHVKSSAGYIIDDKVALRFLESQIPDDWITSDNNFFLFVKQTVAAKYPDKTESEKRTLFISAVSDWENLREEYPAWLNKQESSSRKKAVNTARNEKPKSCIACGSTKLVGLTLDTISCKACGGFYEFDSKQNRYVFYPAPADTHDPDSVVDSLRKKSGITRKLPDTF